MTDQRPLRTEELCAAVLTDAVFVQICARQIALFGECGEENRRELDEAADRLQIACKFLGAI